MKAKEEILIVKLGGSLITEKKVPYSVRQEVITNCVDQILKSKKKVIIVHGGGSFGHPTAKKYGIIGGPQEDEEKQIYGLAKTHANMEKLDAYLRDEFLNHKFPALSFQPSSIFLKISNGNFTNFLNPISVALDFGIIPILYGDIILTNEESFTIISGDEIIYELCKNLESYSIAKVIFATEEDGIFITDEEGKSKLLAEIKADELDKIQLADLGSKIDVTGGISLKLAIIKKITDLKIPVQVINGLTPLNILNSMENKELKCTTILPSDSNILDSNQKRKIDHLTIPLRYNVQHQKNYLKYIHLIHHALPEIDLEDIDLRTNFFRKFISAPICIAAMTGGHEVSKKLNEILANAAQKEKIIMSVGSQRVGLEKPETIGSFSVVREVAPDIPIIGNLGIGQISDKKFKTEDFIRCIEMIKADAMAIHFNALHELSQKEGNISFKQFESNFLEIRKSTNIPLIAKEVGSGLNKETAVKLEKLGFDGYDVGGMGGTSFAAIESYRNVNDQEALTRDTGTVFREWGIPTPASILQLREVSKKPIIATGGLRTGIDIAKCISLGADIGGFAYPFLKASWHDYQQNVNKHTLNEIQTLKSELQSSLWLLNVKKIEDLKGNKQIRRIDEKLQIWLNKP